MGSIDIPKSGAPDVEFENLLTRCGRMIGCGRTREAYAVPSHADKIMKVSSASRYVNNWTEIVVYQNVTDNSFLGRISAWSESGRFLIMERLDDVSRDEVTGLHVPGWWLDRDGDIKNIGRSLTGQLKLRDYGSLSISPDVLAPFV